MLDVLRSMKLELERVAKVSPDKFDASLGRQWSSNILLLSPTSLRLSLTTLSLSERFSDAKSGQEVCRHWS